MDTAFIAKKDTTRFAESMLGYVLKSMELDKGYYLILNATKGKKNIFMFHVDTSISGFKRVIKNDDDLDDIVENSRIYCYWYKFEDMKDAIGKYEKIKNNINLILSLLYHCEWNIEYLKKASFAFYILSGIAGKNWESVPFELVDIFNYQFSYKSLKFNWESWRNFN